MKSKIVYTIYKEKGNSKSISIAVEYTGQLLRILTTASLAPYTEMWGLDTV